MALFDNIIDKYFKTPDPEEPSVDDYNVPPTEDKAETTTGTDVGTTADTTAGTTGETTGETTADTTADTAADTTAESSATEQSDSSEAGAYTKLREALYGSEGEPESQEDIEAREKRERRNSTISALGDAIGGIVNIWGATKGATPMDLSSLSEANKRRYDYAKESRERNQEARRRGMYTAGAEDIRAQERAEELRRVAEERAAAQRYREEQDKVKEEQWQTTYDFNAKQAEEKAELDRQRFEETQRRNEEDLKIRKRTIALAEKKAADALNAIDTGPAKVKVTRFGLSDGSNITVPDDLRGSYVADVYNQLVDAAGGATIDGNSNTNNPILSFMKFQYGQKEPGLNEMMTAVQLYKDKYPGIEDYMIDRANEYTENYNTPVEAKDLSAPGSPGESTVPLSEDEELPPLTDDDLLEYLDED